MFYVNNHNIISKLTNGYMLYRKAYTKYNFICLIVFLLYIFDEYK